ncbi:MAG TPA: PQQ-binding-like beta-propeller repeat protein [Candidatus Acidoferrales bacterium]|nr:PQQ-binding-like beta-propeller repeat protein [Candidatus Acidoferrales bacterium]
MNTKTMASLIAILLLSSIVISIGSLQMASAHNPAWEIPTWCYVTVSPNPVGVGQQLAFVMWNTRVPDGALVTNDIRWKNFTLVITKPDNTTEVLKGFNSDPTGSTYAQYTPNQVGNWTVKLIFPAQILSTQGAYANDTFKESTFTTTFTVQEDPVSSVSLLYPLPTEYWTRPIEGQNNEWYTIASNWLRGAATQTQLSTGSPGTWGRVQPYGAGPESGHIMWTAALEDGGVVGGENTAIDGNVFYSGTQYNPRFNNAIIMNGRIYYSEPKENTGTNGDVVCRDLRTGEELWRRSDITMFQFGMYYGMEYYNQHGVIPPGVLFRSVTVGTGSSASTTLVAHNPMNGREMGWNLTFVPSGTLNNEAIGPNGEVLRYQLQSYGTGENRYYNIMQWNITHAYVISTNPTNPGTLQANSTMFYDFNQTVTYKGNNFTVSGASIQAVIYNDIALFRNGTLQTQTTETPTPYTYFAIDINQSRSTFGQVTWMKNYDPPTGNITLVSKAIGEGVFTMLYKETYQWAAFDMHTGEELWNHKEMGFSELDYNAYGYFSGTTENMNTHAIYDGKLFSTGYTGMLFAYDLYTGELLWKYDAPANMEVFKYYTLHIGAIADGKVYLGSHEHSASTPLLKGNLVRSVNASNGAEIWTLPGWAAAYSPVVADGYMAFANLYDNQVYVVGKGPSQTDVDINNDVIQKGSSVLITGSVMDIAAGTTQNEQAARFPDGVPAVSDASQGTWMAYVYEQKPCPANVTGVQVTLNVIDANGNYQTIGTATTTNGFYSLAWTPEIEGTYTVFASFAGTNSYYPSNAITAFTVDPAAATPTPQPTQAPSAADLYFIPAIAALLVAIVIAMIALVLKKHP